MQSLPRLGSLRGRGAIPPIRQGNSEGKREVLLVRDVHDRVTQREERGRLEVAIDGGEARRGAGEREGAGAGAQAGEREGAGAGGRRPETARARGRRPWSPLTEARSPLTDPYAALTAPDSTQRPTCLVHQESLRIRRFGIFKVVFHRHEQVDFNDP